MNAALERLRRRVGVGARDLGARYRPYGDSALRISVGIVFAWFGVLKFLPGASPAEDIATRCMEVLTFGMVPADATRILLACMELAIGLGLITGLLLRTALTVFFVHMAGVFTALVIVPELVWTNGSPLLPTMEGQYIIKNIVLVAACLTVATRLPSGPPPRNAAARESAAVPTESAPRDPADGAARAHDVLRFRS
ncbi:DoxX family membrane protein [Streptomyces sp. NPDC002773]|uniref:DoxX family membrane protein n=1 Tax=Streptomyces sp. NPDC002773 TaxID=3154430 RepID=UPI00331C1F5B